MQDMEKNKSPKVKPEIIAIIGKSASGKNTIFNEVLRQSQEPLNRIICFTTRPPRENEINGQDYIFLTSEELIEKFDANEIAEVHYFNGWGYGTLHSAIRADMPNIGVFNPDAVLTLLEENEYDVKIYYINASDKARLMRSLSREKNPDIDEIVRRYQAEKKEHANFPFDLIKKNLTNEDDEDFYNCVEYILQAECLKDN